jgi:hypothetical protein
MKTEIETSDARVMAAAASNENLVILALLEATGQAGGLPAVPTYHPMIDGPAEPVGLEMEVTP